MLPSVDALLAQPFEVRQAAVEVLAWVMGADGELRPEEIGAVEDLARRLELRWRAGSQVPSWNEAWPRSLAPVAPVVLQLACMLATADGDLAEVELECLELLQAALGLDPGSVGAMCTWAQEGHRWAHKGAALLHEAMPGGYALG